MPTPLAFRMPVLRWRVCFTKRRLPRPLSAFPLLDELGELDGWLDEHRILDGLPFLIDPEGRYDGELNQCFTGSWLRNSPRNTQAAVAYDLKKWLDFLSSSRGGQAGSTWHSATPEDRAAFEQWRRKDPRGPRVTDSTWDREVATVNGFYRWAVREGFAAVNPLIQRLSRSRHRNGRDAAAETPAEASHQGPRRDLKWLTAGMYRQWRDVGVRGFTAGGLPDASFRGRFASRNAAFTDLMIRTGLRISEQVALTLFELPELVPGVANARTRLPNAIAKYGSGRAIYIPASALRDVWDYVEMERADAVEEARAAGVYDRFPDPLIVEDRQRARVRVDDDWVSVAQLDPQDRRRLLVRTAAGLEPAALWLTRQGTPATVSSWQQVFEDANGRCERQGVPIRCHPHALRHSFAVITLEQLWRGHLAELGTMNLDQRETYQMVFGDPLNWVRMRLGHRSVEITQIYLNPRELHQTGEKPQVAWSQRETEALRSLYELAV
ncbi:tyrosine-type recombinase/integrase [Streptomyces europaeiscabiei]|uniref:tyrosine-type recombinase/integrase n=1 Tax=Streptomyces europaeiscabiei TaxID=146819 RepID=UPI002E137DD4|nr:tyrosine-type recombinase/integrase [Streptomyces europaeiscabiei]